MPSLTPEQLRIIRDCCKNDASYETVLDLFNQVLSPPDSDALTADPSFAQRILRVTPHLVYVYDLEQRRYIYWNDNLTKILGYTRQQIDAMGDLMTILLAHPDDLGHLLEYYMQATLASDDDILTLEYRLENAEGQWVWLYSQEIVFSRSPDGAVRQILGIARDTSELKATAEALRRSETFYRAVVDIQMDLVARFDMGLHLTFANEAYCRFFGQPLEQLLGRSILPLIPETEYDEFAQAVANLIETGNTHVEERFSANASGELRWIQWTAQPIVSNWGEVIEIQATGRDLTERKQAELELHRSRAQYELLIRNLPDSAVMLFDRDLRYQRVEGDFLSALGYKKADVEGKTLREVLPPEATAKLEPYYQAALEGKEVSFDYNHANSILEVNIVPVTEKNGEIIGGMLLFRDVTDQRAAVQQQFELSLEKERVRLLTEFIQNVSHEFRTPLSVINSSAHLLTRQTDPEKRHAHFLKITSHVENLTQLVDDLLELSRLDTHKPNHQREAVDLNGIARAVVADHQEEIFAKGLNLVLEFDQSLPYVAGSATAIQSTIDHVIENALRYTPAGGQIIIGSRHDDHFAVLTVTDTGIGIDAETMPRIFDTFYRADIAHSTHGFGLGLSIARRIVEAHNGRIYVESQPNKGSTFSICLPVRSRGA